MTSPPQEIDVECPKCKRTYEATYRASINLGLEPLTSEDIERMSTAICPDCGHKVPLNSLTVCYDDEARPR